MSGRQVYISYSRRADYSFIKRLIKKSKTEKFHSLIAGKVGGVPIDHIHTVTDPHNEAEFRQMDTVEHWAVTYDQNSMKPGRDFISEFMATLSGADKIIFLLSEEYFYSPFCMHELLAIYNKQAEKVHPVVVLPPNISALAALEKRVIAHWQDQQCVKNNAEAKKKCEEFVRDLPYALTWLLGPFDLSLEYYKPLFIQGERRNSPQQVFDALSFPFDPIFRPFAEPEIQRRIYNDGKGILEKKIPQECVDLVQSILLERGIGDKKITDYYNSDTAIDQIMDFLRIILIWITRAKGLPKEKLAVFVVEIQELVGLMLLKTVDQKNIQLLAYCLNDKKMTALEGAGENRSVFQIVVSALWATPPAYYIRAQDQALLGKGDMDLLVDRGGSLSNLSTLFSRPIKEEGGEKEGNIKALLEHLFHVLCSSKEEGLSSETMMGRLRGEIDTRKFTDEMDSFLIMQASDLKGKTYELEYRREIQKVLPEVLHIIVDMGKESLDKFLLQGIPAPGLHQIIQRIYERIEELKNVLQGKA